jgi:predicted flap endonuclease-1-like 5' DNA nuclease
MSYLTIQTIVLLILAFLLGLYIGHWLYAQFKPAVKPVMARPQEPMVVLKPEPVSFKTEPVPFNTPMANTTTLAEQTPEQLEALLQSTKDSTEPVRLKAPEKGTPDPLIDIIGIGPANEKELHELGIYHFWQIAEWTPENIKWVSEQIRFPGRIVRENWMKQARDFMVRRETFRE